MANLDGQTFAGYEIIETLGEGAMGIVYKAREALLGRIVALKVLSPQLASNPEDVARFKQEAIAAAPLDHPNIVRVFTAGEFEGQHFFVMEFVEGQSLEDRLHTDGRMQPQEALAACIYVAEGLKHAWHKARIIHRDIKPANIFLSVDGSVKVGDLGLAKSIGGGKPGLTHAGITVGTPNYMSPEQATAKKDMDFRSDIYSLGCMLYHMLSGERPYEGGSSMEVMMRHLNEPPPAILKVLPACPMPLVMLLNKMLAKHPSGRHQSYEELIADLWRVHDIIARGGAAPVPQARASAGARPAASPARRQSSTGILIAAGTLALVAAGVFVAAPWKKTPTEPQPPQQAAPDTARTGPATAPAEVAPMAAPETAPTLAPAVPSAATAPPAASAPPPAMPDGTPAAQLAFFQEVAPLPAPDQAARVIAKLKELNPDFDTSNAQFEVSGEQVTRLDIPAAGVTEIWPVAALRGLQTLSCGTRAQRAPLANIAPLQNLPLAELRIFNAEFSDLSLLRGMKLRSLYCPRTKVSDLAPLAGMPLTELALGGTQVADLSPLRGMAITNLFCEDIPITDVAALQGMPLTLLNIRGTRASDLSPLQDAPLRLFICSDSAVTNLAPIAGAPLRALYCDVALLQQPANAAIVRNMATLKIINNQPATNVLATLPAAPVEAAAPPPTPVSPPAMASATPAPAPADPWANAINLLAMTDPYLDRVGGSWTVVEGHLTSGNESGARIEIPYEPPDEYDFRVTFVRREGSGAIVQFLTQSGHPFAWEMGGENNTIFRFVTSGEKWGLPNLTIVRRPACLQNGRAYTALVQVRRWGAAAYLDNARVSQSRLNYNFVDLSRYEVLRNDRLIGLGSINGSASFLRAELLEITGRGKPRRAAGAAPQPAAPSPAVAPGTVSAPATFTAEQLTTLGLRLKAINPEFDGEVSPITRSGEVIGAQFSTAAIKDLSPVRELPGLRELRLRPTRLTSNYKGMVSDLSALRGQPLTAFDCSRNPVRDLSPLAGMPLTSLDCSYTEISDLAPLKNMPLRTLLILNTPVSDLTPLATLASLDFLNCHRTRVTDLSPLRDVPLGGLWCGNGDLADLSPLKGKRIRFLHIQGSKVQDLTPLAGMPLTDLWISGAPVSDLSPLRGMKLTYLDCSRGRVTDLSPLTGMPLVTLRCDFDAKRDTPVLRTLTNLKTVNGRPVAEVLGIP